MAVRKPPARTDTARRARPVALVWRPRARVATILDVLGSEHASVLALLSRLLPAGRSSCSERLREEHFLALSVLLHAHMAFEEAAVYPQLLPIAPDRASALAAHEEHHQMRFLLSELRSRPAGDERWFAKLRVLGDDLVQHIRHEEETLFPRLARALSPASLRVLAVRYEQQRECAAPSFSLAAGA